MKKFALVLLAISVSTLINAQVGDNDPDARVKAVLDQIGYKYTVDKDNDFQLVFNTGDDTVKQRTQMVFINSNTLKYDNVEVREIWSVCHEVKVGFIPCDILNTLMKKNADLKIGSWCYEERDSTHRLYFSVKVGVNVNKETLISILSLVATSADSYEAELTGDADKF